MICERTTLTECKRHERVIAYPCKEISSYLPGSSLKKSCVPSMQVKLNRGGCGIAWISKCRLMNPDVLTNNHLRCLF